MGWNKWRLSKSSITLKTIILKSSLCDYSDAYILVKGTISIALVPAAHPNNNDKEVVFKNCGPFIDCISEVKKIQIDNAREIHVAMPMYNLKEYSNS